MKTLTKNNFSFFICEDDVSVVMTSTEITIGDPEIMIFGESSSEDSVLHEGVTPPDDWYAHKYTYDGTWALNPDWVVPPEPEVPEVLFDSDGNPIEPTPE
jgi:hypothetical protein